MPRYPVKPILNRKTTVPYQGAHTGAPYTFFMSSAQIAAAAMRPMLPKNNFLFDKIEKKPVFMRLFSILSACFLFDKIGDNITLQQYIITKVTV